MGSFVGGGCKIISSNTCHIKNVFSNPFSLSVIYKKQRSKYKLQSPRRCSSFSVIVGSFIPVDCNLRFLDEYLRGGGGFLEFDPIRLLIVQPVTVLFDCEGGYPRALCDKLVNPA